MEALTKIEMPGDMKEIPGIDKLPLTVAMVTKNGFVGFPTYLYSIDGIIVGIAIVNPDAYPGAAKLWCLEVAEGFRGMGIGRKLLTTVLDEYGKIRLVAMRDAFGFYMKLGFVFKDGEEPDPKSNVGYMVSN